MEYQGKQLRHELKYYINQGVYHTLRERFLHVMKPDENMTREDGYLISSLYFDDIFHSALEQKISGTRFCKKYRIRVYEHSDELIKLECKYKFDCYISKDSAILSRDEYNSILEGDYEFLIHRPETLCREFYAFHNSRLLKPVVVVEYTREAYISDLGNVRLTFDKNIAASFINVDIFSKDYSTIEVLPQKLIIFEVKYDDYIPSYIKSMIQSGMKNKCAISKYVMCRKINKSVKQL